MQGSEIGGFFLSTLILIVFSCHTHFMIGNDADIFINFTFTREVTCKTSKTIKSMKNYKLIGIIPFSESFFIPTVPPVYRTRTSEDLAGVMSLITRRWRIWKQLIDRSTL